MISSQARGRDGFSFYIQLGIRTAQLLIQFHPEFNSIRCFNRWWCFGSFREHDISLPSEIDGVKGIRTR